MATTSLWRIKGYMGKVVDYVENPDKTISPERITEADKTAEEMLGDVIRYAAREEATNLKQLVYGINVDPSRAREEMLAVKRKYDKEGGTIAYHGYQSFKEGEVTPEQAHEIGKELADRLWGDRYQVLICTHLDKASHIHNHFVINTVSHIDGKKFFRSERDYQEMRKLSDQLCWQRGLSVIDPPKGKGKQYNEWSAEKNGKPTYRGMVKSDIDDAIKQSLTDREFFRILEQKGYELKLRSDTGKLLRRPSLRPKGATRFFRFDRLGDEYSLDEIKYRILENIRRQVPFPEAEKEEIRTYRREHPPKTKHKGFAALYYYYCYELHIIAKHPASVKQMSFFMREDIRKLEKLDEQTRFLGANNIETLEDLNAYRGSAAEKIQLLEWERQVQRNILKQEVRKEDLPSQDETRKKIAGITAEIKQLRKNLRTCDEAEKRSARMQIELGALAGAEKTEKEERDELFRRSSGAGSPYVSERR